MTIDKNQAAMVEQSPLSEKHWRPDDDNHNLLTCFLLRGQRPPMPQLHSVHTSTSSQCVCAWRAITFHVHVQFIEMLFWHFCEIAPPGWNAKLDQAISRAGRGEAVHMLELFCARLLPWSSTAEKRCAWNNCGSVWRNGARKPFPCSSTRFSQCASL